MPRAFLLAVTAAAGSLLGCANAGNPAEAESPAQNLAATIAPAATAPAAPHAAAPANELTAQLQAELQSLQPMLPIRVDRVSQIVAIHLEGTEVVYSMRYSIPIPDLNRVRREAQAHAQTSVCANGPASALIRQGATMRYDYTDSVGLVFHTRVISCP